MILAEDVEVTLAPGETKVLERDAYCGVSTYGCPSGQKGAMAMTPFVLVVPGVLISQSKVWAHLDPFSPGRQALAGLSAVDLYTGSPELFSAFDASCRLGHASANGQGPMPQLGGKEESCSCSCFKAAISECLCCPCRLAAEVCYFACGDATLFECLCCPCRMVSLCAWGCLGCIVELFC